MIKRNYPLRSVIGLVTCFVCSRRPARRLEATPGFLSEGRATQFQLRSMRVDCVLEYRTTMSPDWLKIRPSGVPIITGDGGGDASTSSSLFLIICSIVRDRGAMLLSTGSRVCPCEEEGMYVMPHNNGSLGIRDTPAFSAEADSSACLFPCPASPGSSCVRACA